MSLTSQENISLKVAAFLGQGFRWLTFEDWQKVYQPGLPERTIEFFETGEPQKGVQSGRLGYYERMFFAILDLNKSLLFAFPRSDKVPKGVLFRFKEDGSKS